MSTPTEKFLVGSFFSVPIFIVISVIINAFVFKTLWGWFVSETFGITQIGYFQAAGIILLFRLLMVGQKGGYMKRFDKEKFHAKMDELNQNEPEMAAGYMRKSISSRMSKLFTVTILVPLLLLFSGWVVHFFV